MDLFDFGNYFGSYVPGQARSHPLLKHAACAYAAKQLSRVNGVKASPFGVCSKDATVGVYDDPSIGWELEGAYHYEESIALLMDTMQQSQGSLRPVGHDARSPSWGSLASFLEHLEFGLSLRSGRSVVQSKSDEIVAAAAILCAYEFISATGAACSQHLNGMKWLLGISGGNIMPPEMSALDSFFLPQNRNPSKARRATFWNFARQDYIAACELQPLQFQS